MQEFSRFALYELVWSQPRSVLAKSLDISDVGLAKACTKANIPMPPRGYWAKLEGGKKLPRPPIPLRLPGEYDTVSFGPETRYRPDKLTDIIASPHFEESVEALVSAASARIGTLIVRKDLRNPHPGLNKVLSAESRRREKHKANPTWSFNAPYFDAPQFQRQLRLFNCLLWGFDNLGCKGWVSVRDEWTQGVGTFHFLVGNIRIGDVTIPLHFIEPTTTQRKGKQEAKASTVLRADSWRAERERQEWEDASDNPLERQMTQIATSLLENAEKWLRTMAEDQYKQKLDRRAALEQSIREQKEADEKKRIAALAQEEQRRREHLFKVAAELAKAREIRNLVDSLGQRPDAANGGTKEFSDWRNYALSVAEQLDPLMKPLSYLYHPGS